MPRVNFTDILPYKAEDLYNLVMDVERYTDIFKDVKYIGVLAKQANKLDVEVRAGEGLESISYRCDVTGTPHEKIGVEATSGDFESMSAEWNFHAMPDGQTKVSYKMDFDFGGLGLKNMAATLFIEEQAAKVQSDLKNYARNMLKPVLPPPTGPA